MALMPDSPSFEAVQALAHDRLRACSDANLALRAGLNALEDARQKVRERLTTLREDEGDNRPGLREGLAIVGNLILMTQHQVPISDGQLMEARYALGSIQSLLNPPDATGDSTA